jgi:anti-sigma regulatory factor (Ser/Thr protein kinase)
MNAMAPTRPTELHGCCVRLTTGPAAAVEARSQVRAAICAWDVPVDPSVAVLLTSELVTNAIRHEPGDTVTLAITCSYGRLRVDVHDRSCSLPVLMDAPADAETGRGLMLVATLSAEWGVYRTLAGKAVYFTLAFQPAILPRTADAARRGSDVGTVSHVTPRRFTVPTERPAIPAPRSPRRNGAQG